LNGQSIEPFAARSIGGSKNIAVEARPDAP
jgi:hypothetical protein